MVERWVVYSIREEVMPGVRFFLVMRMLRGGEGHWRERRVLSGCWR